ncbi:MAG: hypothetical protein SOU07_05160 [Bacilli bacterium]|nr:hypothetical protein [Acholeplasmataceae bacterium]MDY2902807.1 hypothetical protein [Bacilli bacterium]
MYKQLIVITNTPINEELLKNFDYKIINNNFELINTYKLKYNNEEIDFDYIISDRLINNLLIEDGYIITNQFYEGSIDNYFIIGPLNKSINSTDNQIKTIIDYLNGNI